MTTRITPKWPFSSARTFGYLPQDLKLSSDGFLWGAFGKIEVEDAAWAIVAACQKTGTWVFTKAQVNAGIASIETAVAECPGHKAYTFLGPLNGLLGSYVRPVDATVGDITEDTPLAPSVEFVLRVHAACVGREFQGYDQRPE